VLGRDLQVEAALIKMSLFISAIAARAAIERASSPASH
jgi:hypothetical protein